ncbi:MAG: amino acid ABC transporter ATP-binding protein [Hoeflea sp. BRH_c9]|nr:MAG: amino acid ABC transporter ATP-binding protein [Hoeflea sp. BRH_c9]
MNGDIILETRGLKKAFGGFTAVSDVNLKVRRNGFHGLIGPNGAGKSTFFNLITRFLEPTEGTIAYNGQDISRVKAAKLPDLGILRSFQISAVFPRLTLLENVRLALQHGKGVSYQFWRNENSLNDLNDRAESLLADVGLGGRSAEQAGTLPYGSKRALELATTLAFEPELMLLDEPMAGLGTEDIGRISDLLEKASQGRTILMVEHNMHVVARLCDRITVLARGEVLAEGTYAEVSTDPRVIESYVGRTDAA